MTEESRRAILIRTVQARLLRALSESGSEVPVSSLGAVGPEAAVADDAIADLEDADLVRVSPDGRLGRGSRGSVLSVEAVMRRRTGGRFGSPLEILAAVPSTNDVVLERAAAGGPAGLAVAAELQTAGRGRRGRSFDSRPGLGLWVTVRLDPPAEAASAPRASLIAGIAVAEAVESVVGDSPELKWPNDLRLGGRKICGILVEARSAGRRLLPVAGIGVNVHHRTEDFPASLADTAGSLESVTGRPIDRSELLARILDRLEVRFGEEARGRLDLPLFFAPRDALADRAIEVRTPDGVLTGVARGIALDGALRLETDDGAIVPIRSGEASPRPIA